MSDAKVASAPAIDDAVLAGLGPIGAGAPIERIDEIVVSLPFVAPFSTSAATWSCKEALLLRIEGGGAVGWGECVADPDPFYAPETVTSCRHIVREFLLPRVEDGMGFGELERRIAPVRGNRMAKATLENALLDWTAKRRGLPLCELLGFAPRPVPSGISIGLQPTVEDLVARVEEAVAAGYHRVKIKIARGRDLALVEAIRTRWPELPLMVDANSDYRLADADRLAELDRFALTMIEQPLATTDLYEHSLLQRRLATPICLDESLHDLADVEAALALGACRVVNVKQGRVGGILESLRIARHCAAHGVPVWSGGMDETGIGRAFNIHLQTAPGFTLPGDTSETRRYFAEDLVEPPVVLGDGGWIAVPAARPGIGVEVVGERLARFTLSSERLR